MKIVVLLLAGLFGHAFLLSSAVLTAVPLARAHGGGHRWARSRPHAPAPVSRRIAHTPIDERLPLVATDAEARADASPRLRPVALAARPPKVVSSPTVLLPDASDVRARFESRFEQIPICRMAGDTRGRGKAAVHFYPGGAIEAELTAPFEGTPAGDCIRRRLASGGAPFQGEAFDVVVTFAL